MSTVTISGAVEGPTDEPVIRRIIEFKGGVVHRVQVPQGKQNLRMRLPGYNAAARRSPWLVLVDLNGSHACPAALLDDWLPHPSPFMRLRVVVRSIEAWLLADRDRVASWFSVPVGRVPSAPDGLPNPKQALLSVIQRSRRREMREDMLPRPGSGVAVGPAYRSRVIEFATDLDQGWRPAAAALASPSLRRCLTRLEELIDASKA